MATMVEWLVLADDRTGALEVGGEVANWIGPVPVVVSGTAAAGGLDEERDGGAGGVRGDALTIDLGSRHLTPDRAAALAAHHAIASPARRQAHKIDSLLRGNWAHELVAVQRVTGHRTLVVPAFPALGRTCRGGEVHVDGRRAAAADVRHGVPSARVAEHLVAAGATDVVELGGAAGIATWTSAFAVCDAASDDDLRGIGAAWAAVADDVRFAGTAGSIAAAVAACARAEVAPGGIPTIVSSGTPLVVCGSRHPMALAQLDALGSWCGEVDVLRPPQPAGHWISSTEADRVAGLLGAMTRRRIQIGDVGMLLIVGGDTAAAVLGDAPMLAGGTVGPGMPWSRRVDGSGPLVVTKAGGFGHPTTLVELLLGRFRSEA